MTVIEITRPARCGDCAYLKDRKIGKWRRHFCNNKKSPHFEQPRILKDLVCDKWAIINAEEK